MLHAIPPRRLRIRQLREPRQLEIKLLDIRSKHLFVSLQRTRYLLRAINLSQLPSNAIRAYHRQTRPHTHSRKRRIPQRNTAPLRPPRR